MQILRSIIQLTRAFMSATMGLAAVAGARYSWAVESSPPLAAIFVGQFCIASSCFVINDILDRERDLGNKARPLGHGGFSVTKAYAVLGGLIGAGSILTLVVSGHSVIVGLCQVLAAVIYSPLKARTGVMANLLTACFGASAFFFAGALRPVSAQVVIAMVLTFLAVIAREVMKDTVDLEADRKHRLPTVPLRYGLRASAWLVVVSITSCALLALYAVVSGMFIFPCAFFILGSAALFATGAACYVAERSPRIMLGVTALGFPLAVFGFLFGR